MNWALDRLGRALSGASASWTSSDDVIYPPPPKKCKFATSSSTPVPEDVVVALQDQIRQINDEVHLGYEPRRRPSVDIVFFHGLQWDGNQDEYIKTWVSRGGFKLWIRWILEDIPDARIFITSYDACVRRTWKQGNINIHRVAENMVHSLTRGKARVGQYGCPVVLVGHCVGGPVMETLSVLANSMLGQNPSKPVQNFFNRLRGFFFYGSPLQGISQINMCKKVTKGALLENVSTLGTEASRTKEEFRMLRRRRGWRSFAVGEGCPVTFVCNALQGTFRGVLVPESSARYDVDGFYTDNAADHFDVSRPASTTSSSFSLLCSFVAGMIEEGSSEGVLVPQSSASLSCGDSLIEHILSGFDYNQGNWPGVFTGGYCSSPQLQRTSKSISSAICRIWQTATVHRTTCKDTSLALGLSKSTDADQEKNSRKVLQAAAKSNGALLSTRSMTRRSSESTHTVKSLRGSII